MKAPLLWVPIGAGAFCFCNVLHVSFTWEGMLGFLLVIFCCLTWGGNVVSGAVTALNPHRRTVCDL